MICGGPRTSEGERATREGGSSHSDDVCGLEIGTGSHSSGGDVEGSVGCDCELCGPS